jgi:RsiW-degrading membrane proteinase PrsW (M82 family)
MRHRAVWLIAGIAGGILVLLGCAGGLLALAVILAGGEALSVAQSLPVAGMMALGLGLGVPLVLHGWAGWQMRSSRPFRPSRVWWMWLALLALIGLGTAVSLLSLSPALLLPPIHVLVMAFPPLIVLWLVGRAVQEEGISWREVVATVAGGGYLGVGLSLVGEGLIAFALAVVATIVVLIMPDGAERIATLVSNLQDPAWLVDLDNLLPFLLSPAVAISVLGMFCIPVPLIEEIVKTLAVGVAARWARPHPARAFLWGVASGAGFALTENLFNGALGGAEGWTLGVVARLGATVMHCLTGGMVGWGWGQLWTGRRPLRLLVSFVAAVLVHSLWNAATVGLMLLSADALTHAGDEVRLALTNLGMLVFIGLLGVLALVFFFAMPLIGRRLAAAETEWATQSVPATDGRLTA